MAKKFKVSVTMKGEAFDSDFFQRYELAHMLRELADKLMDPNTRLDYDVDDFDGKPLLDTNGNTAGKVTVK